mmetsp:Transcript_121691/g.242425  ORF Transcript_121691/g.242425 Transcript_121691/m.242425 type:complete len:108 (-) Transcript_121691:23-346(-)
MTLSSPIRNLCAHSLSSIRLQAPLYLDNLVRFVREGRPDNLSSILTRLTLWKSARMHADVADWRTLAIGLPAPLVDILTKTLTLMPMVSGSLHKLFMPPCGMLSELG